MPLPNHEKAFIPTEKLSDYLLSTTHSVGKGKAKFFREFGFDTSNIGSLASGLLSIAKDGNLIQETPSPFGVKFVIDGNLSAPNGMNLSIRTIWITETGEDKPRFVTAYPK